MSNKQNEDKIVLDFFSRYGTPRREIEVVPFKEVFGYAPVNPHGDEVDIYVERFKEPHAELTPAVNEDFVLDREAVSSICGAFLRRRPLMQTGLPGCGKSEHVEQIMARLNCELIVLQLTEDTEVSDIIGQFILKNDETVFVDGPATAGFRHGYPVLLDEADYPRPGVMTRANGFLHGSRMFLESSGKGEGGEVIQRHKDATYFGTMNTTGDGDHSISGAMSGTQPQNAATMTRWRFVEKQYPSAKDEKSIIKKACPHALSDYVEILVETLAPATRSAASGGELRVPLGTRDLVMMAEIIEDTNDVRRGFKECYFNRVGDSTQREALKEIFQRCFDMPLYEEAA